MTRPQSVEELRGPIENILTNEFDPDLTPNMQVLVDKILLPFTALLEDLALECEGWTKDAIEPAYNVGLNRAAAIIRKAIGKV